MTRAQLLKRRANKAWTDHLAKMNSFLRSLSPYSAADRIKHLVSLIERLSEECDRRTYIDRQIHIRVMAREILAISEHMLTRCHPDFAPYFTEKRDYAVIGILRCNERIK